MPGPLNFSAGRIVVPGILIFAALMYGCSESNGGKSVVPDTAVVSAPTAAPTEELVPTATPELFEGCANGDPTPEEYLSVTRVLGQRTISFDVPTAWSVDDVETVGGAVYELRLGKPQTCRALLQLTDFIAPATFIFLQLPSISDRFGVSKSTNSGDWQMEIEQQGKVLTLFEEYEVTVDGKNWPTIVGTVNRVGSTLGAPFYDPSPEFRTFPTIDGVTYTFRMDAGADYANSKAIYAHVLDSIVIADDTD